MRDGFARTWRRPPSKEELQRPDRGLYPRRSLLPRREERPGLIATTSSSAAACGRRWSFWPRRFRSRTYRRASLGPFSRANPDRFRTEDRLSFHQVFLSPSRRADTIDGTEAGRDRSFRHAPRRRARRSSAIRSCSARSFDAVSQRDVASTFGDGFARRVFRVRTRAMAGTGRFDLRTAFRLYHRTQQREPAAAGCGPGGGRPRVGECAPDRGGTEALPLAAGPLRDHRGGDAAQVGNGRRVHDTASGVAVRCWAGCWRGRRARMSFGPATSKFARPRPTPTVCCSRYRRRVKTCGSRSMWRCRKARTIRRLRAHLRQRGLCRTPHHPPGWRAGRDLPSTFRDFRRRLPTCWPASKRLAAPYRPNG